ncbi:hypothetical protein ABDK00_013565 [Niabella insulamsoli]|uniref:hypothetical protein n=1 Tax=Niabella insulamsoli TaxID=3144874 RepID=UPI0031FD5333
MIIAIRYLNLCIFLFSVVNGRTHEKTAPKDFGLPQNTVKATITYADFSIPRRHLSMCGYYQVYIFQNNQLVNHQQRDSASDWKLDNTYQYEDGQLESKETLGGSNVSMEYKTYNYRTESKGYKTTWYKTHSTGEVEKTIAFYNDAGELRGKSIYNTRGQRTRQIEYGRKEGYRERTYHNEQLMTDITYVNDSTGRLTNTLTIDGSGARVRRIYNYNKKGDPFEIAEFVTGQKNTGQKLIKTTHINYLYDEEIWIAKITYSNATKTPGKLTATIRTIETSEKTYKAACQEQIKDFFEATYQRYLNNQKKTGSNAE